MIKTYWTSNKWLEERQKRWDDIGKRAKSDDPEIRKQASDDFLKMLEGGP